MIGRWGERGGVGGMRGEEFGGERGGVEGGVMRRCGEGEG